VAKNRKDWERIVAEFQRSGATQGVYCRRRGVALSTLQYWIRKLRNTHAGPEVRLLPVRVEHAADRAIEARVGDVALRFEAGTSPAYIAAVLQALRAPC
jgi:transposase-like protein